jgi:hypothetical protein
MSTRASSANRWLLMIGLFAALAGALLVFTLDNHDTTVIGLNLQAVGGVLLVAGLLLLIGLAIGNLGSNGPTSSTAAGASAAPCTGNSESGVRAIGGLIAVVSGTLIVGGLAAFTMTRLGSEEKDSAIAVASAAFGVISAVIGAYLGIKVTADHNTDAKNAAISKQEVDQAQGKIDAAEREAQVTQTKLDGLRDKVEDVLPAQQANEIMAAGFKAAEEAIRTPDPQRG